MKISFVAAVYHNEGAISKTHEKGVALALQVVPVLTPWLNNRAQAEFVIERVRSEELHSTVVALQMRGNRDLPPLPQQLAAFPLGYRYCGMATYPYMQQRIQIWQSQAQ